MTVRALFICYLVGVVGGLAYFVALGLRHA
jgi:hypothetical protein